ncbi:MAG TPA: hypothetical protein VKA37_08455 [Halobacteriales archaeon]|nr:hypothetical protein [Halobacteriales archaeon]
MSTTTERRESAGFVAETIRRPIQDAVREGVRQAMAEQELRRGEPTREEPGEGGGRGWSGLLVLLGIGVAAFLLWRRRSARSRRREERRRTASIREQSKTRGPSTAGGADVSIEETSEAEEASPGAGSE